MGAPVNKVYKTFSQACKRHFLHYKWYYAKRTSSLQ